MLELQRDRRAEKGRLGHAARGVELQLQQCVFSLLQLRLVFYHARDVPHAALLTCFRHAHSARVEGNARHALRWPGIDVFCDRSRAVARVYLSSKNIRSVAYQWFRGQTAHGLKSERVSRFTELAHSKSNAPGSNGHNPRSGKRQKATTTECIHNMLPPARLMWLTKIGECWKIVGVGTNHICCHPACGDEAEDGINHVVAETAAIEEAPRA